MTSVLQLLRSSSVIQNFGWNIAGSIGTKVIGPIFSILVARILSPEAFGVFGVAVAFVAFFELFKDCGLSQTVIVDHQREDFLSLQFTVQFFLALLLYGLIFCAASPMGRFYKMPDLALATKLIGLTLFVSVIEDPLVTHYLKKNDYKLLFVRQFVPSVIFGIAALSCAWFGLGVYALVVAHLVGRFSILPFLFIKTDWMPRFHFKPDVFLRLLRTGKHIVFQQFCSFMVSQGDSLIVGKNLGAGILGVYRMGNGLASLIPNSFIAQVQQVVFTDLAKHKDDIGYLAARYYHFVYGMGLLSLGVSIVSFIAAPFLVPLVLGPKWNQLVPVIQLFSVQFPFIPFVVLDVDIATIYGFRGIYSYYTFFRSTTTVAVLLWASTVSLKAVLVSWVILGIISPIVVTALFFKSQRMVSMRKGFALLFSVSIIYALFGMSYVVKNGFGLAH
jgi:teichuronic acid exporter